jgi:hypothetical protein
MAPLRLNFKEDSQSNIALSQTIIRGANRAKPTRLFYKASKQPK